MAKILEKNKVDIYMDGHDHTMQHLLQGGVNYIVNGVGGCKCLKKISYFIVALLTNSQMHSIIKALEPLYIHTTFV